ncbi:interferon regulatory factor 3-like [Apteryx mantelli]|uniref:Interferon regulatory factor 3-like n=1 Tax=Apteryx mantelli TaxID=2696672 RepID=A0ABM4FZK1_9AVES
MGTPKPLILPWLRAQLDRGGYAGVRWVGATRFRVPWKHGLRHDVAPEDFQLFQDWAIASGCYRPGVDPPAPAVWKRNFRAALNRKPGLRVVEDRSGDAGDPHKVYEFLPQAPGGGRRRPPASPPRGGRRRPGGAPRGGPGAAGAGAGAGAGLTCWCSPAPTKTPPSRCSLRPPDAAPDPPALPPDPPYCPPEDAMGPAPPLQSSSPLPELLIGADELKLIAFMEGRGGSPQYELWLCLGEPWPQPSHTWTRKLVMVQVVPVALRLLHELSRAQGASSLRSSELQLQLSASLGEGGLLGALRSWDERMDSLPPP